MPQAHFVLIRKNPAPLLQATLFKLQALKMKPKTVARNEVESGFKKSTSMIQIHVVSPQGKLEE